MSDQHRETVAPAAFEPIRPVKTTAGSAISAAAAANKRQPHWVWVALASLLIALLAVVFWLPSKVADRTARPLTPIAETSSPAENRSSGAAQGQPAATEASPWSDAQLRKQREEAQAVLQDLLYLQFELEQAGVNVWAGEAFDSARQTAGEADNRYREGDFLAAKTLYQEALGALQRIAEGKDSVFAKAERTGNEAIETADLASAAEAVSILTAINPDSEATALLQRRVDVFPELQNLREQATRLLASGEIAAAVEQLANASKLDPAHEGVKRELATAREQRRNQQFTLAMGRGYQALSNNDFGSAERAFREAAGINPGSKEPQTALQEVAYARQTRQLAELQKRGEAAASAEAWAEAVEAYRAALAIDATIRFASEGLARAEQRQRLDQQLNTALEDPLRLGDPAVHQAVTELVSAGRRVADAGPKLSNQIDRLSRFLELAAQPRRVLVRSDENTEVTVNRVARLGRFSERELELRPGNYTAVGVRPGYRDVRVNFTVALEGAPSPITIRCDERI